MRRSKINITREPRLSFFEHHGRIIEAIKVAIEVLSEPSNLEDAANSYAAKTECAVVACRGFKAGAQWVLNQLK